MNRSQCARRQHRPLNALLAAFFDERVKVAEIAELRFVHRRLCADGQRLSNLGNHHADLTRGHLHPRMLRHGENHAEFETEAGHEQLRLVSRFPTERQRIVSREFGAESFADQSDLRGTDAVDGVQKRETRPRRLR